jgi:hypothetical protein
MTHDQLIDREQIRDLLARYAHAADRLDREMLTAVFWPEGSDDHGIFKGTAAEFVEWSISAMAFSKINRHVLGQSFIQLAGERAAVETYFDSFHRMDMEGTVFDFFVHGRYVDHMEKRGGEWRILHRKVVVDASHGNPLAVETSEMLGPVAEPNRGINGSTDPSVAFIASILS